jgi:hypothetical protein
VIEELKRDALTRTTSLKAAETHRRVLEAKVAEVGTNIVLTSCMCLLRCNPLFV